MDGAQLTAPEGRLEEVAREPLVWLSAPSWLCVKWASDGVGGTSGRRAISCALGRVRESRERAIWRLALWGATGWVDSAQRCLLSESALR